MKRRDAVIAPLALGVATLARTLNERGDTNLIFSAEVAVKLP